MPRWSLPAPVWILAAAVIFGLGLTVGALWPDGAKHEKRTELAATERCLQWLSDLGAGRASLSDEQRRQVRTLVRRGAFSTDEEALFGLWSIGRREPCARAARFGLVGSDGSLGPGTIEILTSCFFIRSGPQIDPDEQNLRRCRRIDDVIGRDPDDFG